MRRLAAASAMWPALAALVMLRVSAMRMKSASEARSGRMAPILREKAPRRDRARVIAPQGQRLVRELAGEQLRADRAPQQAPRAQAGGDMDPVRGGGPEDRQAVGHGGAKAGPPGKRRGVQPRREAGQHRLGAREVVAVVRA